MSNPLPPQSTDTPDSFEARLQQRATIQSNPLSTEPSNVLHTPQGKIPNTPLAAATISFILGSVFSLALFSCILGGFKILSEPYYQLGFFVAAWTAFHWAEFAVTAGWNLEKCSVDCECVLAALLFMCLTCFSMQSLSVGKWRDVPYRKRSCHHGIHPDPMLQAIAQIVSFCIYDR